MRAMRQTFGHESHAADLGHESHAADLGHESHAADLGHESHAAENSRTGSFNNNVYRQF